MLPSKISWRALPLALAWYMARSASRRISSGVPEARRGQRDADRGRDEDLAPLELQRLGELRLDAPGDRLGGLGVGDVLEEEAELVAAQPRHGVARAQRGAEAIAHLHQQLVADRVAERVVDHLEAVEVEEEHGQVLVAPPGAREPVAEPVHEQRPVRQPGQRVAEGLRGQLLEALGELVDLLGLLLDGRHHAVEGGHEGADLVVASACRLPGGLRRGHKTGHARNRAGEVPDDVAAAGHEESGEGDEGRDGERVVEVWQGPGRA